MFSALAVVVVVLKVETFDPLELLIDSEGDLFRLIERRPEGFDKVESDTIRSRVCGLLVGLVTLASFCRKLGAIQVHVA